MVYGVGSPVVPERGKKVNRAGEMQCG